MSPLLRPIVLLVALFFAAPLATASPVVQDWTFEGTIGCVVRVGEAYPCPLRVAEQNDLVVPFTVESSLSLVEVRVGWLPGTAETDPEALYVQLQRGTPTGWETVASDALGRGEWFRVGTDHLGPVTGPTSLRLVVWPGGADDVGVYHDVAYWGEVFETYGF